MNILVIGNGFDIAHQLPTQYKDFLDFVQVKEDIFTGIQFAVNEILRKILPTNKNMICVIHPIAVYYGE